MRKGFFSSLVNVSTFIFIIIVIGKLVIVAQTPITGEWRSETRSKKNSNDENKIHLSFEVKRDRGRNQHGSSFDYSDLQGLTREQTQNGKVKFWLVREAGTIECEGTFEAGKGSGTFRFTPDGGYLSAMRSRGFDFEKESRKDNDGVEARMLSAALINVTVALADDLKTIDLGPLDVDDLFKAAIFKIDSKFMAEMKASGFPGLKMEDLVKARIFKIDGEYVRQVYEMGFAKQDFENLVKFRIFNVTPEFLSELKGFGFTDLSAEEVVKCRIFKIDGDFIRRAKAADPSVSIEEMVRMKIGVSKIKVSI